MKAELTEAIALWAQTRYGAFDAAVRYELLSAEGVVGRFFSSVYLFDVASASDFTVFDASKVVQTPAAVIDVLALSAATSRSDTGQVADLCTAVLGKPFTDVAACTDSAFFLISPSFVDVLTTADATQLAVGKSAADLTTVGDVPTLDVGAQRADSAAAADFSALLVDKFASDAATSADLTSFDFGKQIQDFVFATDDVNGAAVDDDQHIIFFKILSNTSAVFDTISLLATFDRAITDASQVLDVAVLSTAKTLASGAAVGDTVFISFLLVRDFLETVLVSTDQANLSLGKTVEDSLATTDIIGLVSEYNRAFDDTTTVTEVVNKTATKSEADGASVGDTFSLLLIAGRSISDTATAQDILVIVVNYQRVLDDTTTVTEVVSKTATRPEADVVYLSDAFNVILTAVRSDVGLVADSGQLLNQDYVDNPHYFADDYVGVKRIF